MWSVIRKLHTRCDECQGAHEAVCPECRATRCGRCVVPEAQCLGCGSKLARAPAHEASMEQSPPEQEKRPVGKLLARNMHNVGNEFIEKVISVRRKVVSNSHEVSL